MTQHLLINHSTYRMNMLSRRNDYFWLARVVFQHLQIPLCILLHKILYYIANSLIRTFFTFAEVQSWWNRFTLLLPVITFFRIWIHLQVMCWLTSPYVPACGFWTDHSARNGWRWCWQMNGHHHPHHLLCGENCYWWAHCLAAQYWWRQPSQLGKQAI